MERGCQHTLMKLWLTHPGKDENGSAPSEAPCSPSSDASTPDSQAGPIHRPGGNAVSPILIASPLASGGHSSRPYPTDDRGPSPLRKSAVDDGPEAESTACQAAVANGGISSAAKPTAFAQPQRDLGLARPPAAAASGQMAAQERALPSSLAPQPSLQPPVHLETPASTSGAAARPYVSPWKWPETASVPEPAAPRRPPESAAEQEATRRMLEGAARTRDPASPVPKRPKSGGHHAQQQVYAKEESTAEAVRAFGTPRDNAASPATSLEDKTPAAGKAGKPGTGRTSPRTLLARTAARQRVDENQAQASVTDGMAGLQVQEDPGTLQPSTVRVWELLIMIHRPL